ncbi:MAG: hypothetical protein KDD52_06955 [Bdellovibrionales bacterium]|nr:hypothetical protein [Bdellovibrionales bacterium]
MKILLHQSIVFIVSFILVTASLHAADFEVLFLPEIHSSPECETKFQKAFDEVRTGVASMALENAFVDQKNKNLGQTQWRGKAPEVTSGLNQKNSHTFIPLESYLFQASYMLSEYMYYLSNLMQHPKYSELSSKLASDYNVPISGKPEKTLNRNWAQYYGSMLYMIEPNSKYKVSDTFEITIMKLNATERANLHHQKTTLDHLFFYSDNFYSRYNLDEKSTVGQLGHSLYTEISKLEKIIEKEISKHFDIPISEERVDLEKKMHLLILETLQKNIQDTETYPHAGIHLKNIQKHFDSQTEKKMLRRNIYMLQNLLSNYKRVKENENIKKMYVSFGANHTVSLIYEITQNFPELYQQFDKQIEKLVQAFDTDCIGFDQNDLLDLGKKLGWEPQSKD